MPKPGYMTFRVSEGRRHALDSIRIALRYTGPSEDQEGARLTDSMCIDFALDWCLASLPERMTPKQAGVVIRLLNRHGLSTARDDRIESRALDMAPLADRVKDTHSSWPRRRVTGDGEDVPF